MFSRLRLRLTLLYLSVALALIGVVGGGAYRLLEYYSGATTDLALQYRMADEFKALDLALPPELSAADENWLARSGSLLPSVSLSIGYDGSVQRHDDGEDREDDRKPKRDGKRTASSSGVDGPDRYSADLAAIFVLPVSADGLLLSDPNPAAPPLDPDPAAVAAALTQGSDWRTVRLPDGARARLLTYRLPAGAGPAALQLGRVIADQDLLLSQLLVGILGLAGLSAALMGVGSWWLAGRSLLPAQRAWEQQQGFVANASHELRTPLTLIRASAEVAQRGLSADDERRALLGDVVQECDYVGRLVEDLLLLSRLDTGRLALERQLVPLPELLMDLQRQVGRLADERGVKLTADGRGAILGDATRLRQVLLILLDNALRHTPAGGAIRVEARPEGRQVRVIVADTGSGIAPEHLPRVFDRFYRGSNSRDRQTGGTGLGLAIAKALVEAQHGRIAIESRPGQGTRATLTLLAA